MKYLSTLILAFSILASCDSKKTEENAEQADNTETATIPSHNQLTEEEKSSGWKLLFNGENMDGWRTFKKKENDSWEVVDGTLHCQSDSLAKKRADILTVDQYDNFDLVFEWKVAPRDNSGVIYRATEEFDQPYLSGPEYQVIDDKNYPDKLTATQTSASNYDMHAAPEIKKINPPGEWNTGRIVANGNHVEHWLNGEKVVEYEINSDDWKKLKAASKWKDAKGYGITAKGHIDLQDHGGEVWYRNIKIKTL
jgi:hypothetical protein